MSRFRWNLASNFLASIWLAIVQFACVPIYVHLLGVEAYGLVGLHVMLTAVLQALDLGLSPTMNREMAMLSVRETLASKTRNFSLTMEIGYWALGLLLGTLVILFSHAVATKWIETDAVTVAAARGAVMMMGVIIALQWPLSFYQSGLRGLQRQVRLNVVRIVGVTVSNGGAVVALVWFSRSIEMYFAWQIFAMVAQVVLMRVVFWRSLPSFPEPAKFDISAVRDALVFTRGMMGVAICGVILGQMDKLVVSSRVSLQEFGYYTLASTAASGLIVFTSPLFSAVFPRLSAFVASGDEAAIRQTYHSGTQLLACLIVPAALILVFFPADVILAWTQNAEAAAKGAQILRLLAIGTAINGMMHLPYGLQLAYGWTSIAFRLALANLLVFFPLVLTSVSLLGAIGAAASWAVLNAGYLLLGVPLTHRRVLKGSALPWMLKDVGAPVLAATVVVSFAKWAWPQPSQGAGMLVIALFLIAVAGTACAAAALVSPLVRTQALGAGRWLARRIA
ncbi:MAG: oligosaccharide flippase family protein [Pseudomonadota bacterium]